MDFIIRILYMQPKFSKKEQLILSALGNVVINKRKELEKSQRMFAFENDFQKSMISRFEHGANEPKLFSLWRLANACDMKLSEFIKLIEDDIGEDIDFIDKYNFKV